MARSRARFIFNYAKYLAAIRALKRDEIKQFKRTFHIIYVQGSRGLLGMNRFVLIDEFRALNIGYALDEGGVSLSNIVAVTNDEICTWKIEFIAHGVVYDVRLGVNADHDEFEKDVNVAKVSNTGGGDVNLN